MKLLFIQSAAPHGSISAQEGLDALLMGSAFSECSVLFTNEGVLQLIQNQAPDELGTKNFSLTFGALRDYGVSQIFCRQSSMQRYGLNASDCVIDVEVVNDDVIRQLLNEHDKVHNF
ncbi:MAG: sulfurtransferase complex subunit TusC [Gammaproteobacteria bacterium]|jgi:tRNA 2-thiouridine synthesizing protein C|nr:sulfurtransferase complex subunit TusC [Gammaproteobacteria bacterium]MBT7370780.1 sulfurtransferase complex subunit TusC [Gammaproteobacteria bacterium]